MKDAMLSAQPLQARRTPAELPETEDVYKWAFEQAAHVRAGRFDQLDLLNLADEIEDVGLRQYDSFVSNLEIILLRTLKWDYQPKKRSRSWEASIGEHRARVTFSLKDSPSMKAKQEPALERAYRLARQRASGETRMSLSSFPPTCPYSWSDVMDKPFELEDEI